MRNENSEILLSLCIPTNGVVELVQPVLDSIFSQCVDNSLFEVVVADNGNNESFFSMMKEYCKKYNNIVYKKTEAPLFLNEIAAYKMAKGHYIKFLNHRTMLNEGSLQIFIDFVQENIEKDTIAYFSNGVLKKDYSVYEYDNFDDFVTNLSYWSSWSTGMGFWKKDFDSIPEDTIFNELYPHTTILFRETDRSKYIIDNRILLHEIPVSAAKKGKYDIFFAFAVEYPGIISDLLRANKITTDTFLSVKAANLKYLSRLYYDHVIKKDPCSYDLSSFEESIQVYYSKKEVMKRIRYIRVRDTKELLKAMKNRIIK